MTEIQSVRLGDVNIGSGKQGYRSASCITSILAAFAAPAFGVVGFRRAAFLRHSGELRSDSDPQPTEEAESAPAPPPSPSLTHRASWVFFARLVSFAFSILLPLLLTRRLSQEDFGLYKLVFLATNTAAVMLPLGVSMSAYYFLPREKALRGATVLNILFFLATMGSLGGLGVTFFPGILTFIAGDSALEPLAPQIGLLLALWVIGSFLQIAPVANQEERLTGLLMLGDSLVRTALLVGSAALFGTVPALITAAQFHVVIQVTVLLIYLSRRFPGFWRAFEPGVLYRQLGYALPFGLSGLFYTFQTDVHNYFVSHEYGPSVFAIYAIGCFQLPLVGMIGEAANSVLLPQINKLHSEGKRNEIATLALRTGRKLSLAYLPIYGFLTVMGGEFLTVLFTEQYVESLPILRINLLVLLFNLVPTDAVVRAHSQYRYWMLALMATMSATLFVSLIWITPAYGPIGVISAVVLIRFISRAIVALAVGRVLHFAPRNHWHVVRDMLRVAGAAAGAMVVVAVLRSVLPVLAPIVGLTAGAVVFALVYVGILAWLRVPEEHEIGQILGLLSAPQRMVQRLF